MKKRAVRMKAIVVLSVLMTALISVPAQAFDILIDVAPNVLNIQSQSVVVTVHTDIPYTDVVGSSVYLNGIAIDWWKADARGYFVAKFNSEEIKSIDGLILGGDNMLTLTGFTTSNDAFIGQQEITVVDNVPAGKN